MFSHAYNIIIYRAVIAPGYGKYVIHGLNATNQKYLSMLISKSQLPGYISYGNFMEFHTSTGKADFSLAKESQKYFRCITKKYYSSG